MTRIFKPGGRVQSARAVLGTARAACAVVLCLALGAHTAAIARAHAPELEPARVGVSNLKVFEVAGSEPVAIVAAGTKAVEARFDYEEASGHEIALVIKGLGGIDLFRSASVYSGNGAARVAIDGAAIFPRLSGIVDASARDAKRNAKQAATQSVGTQEFLLSVQAGILRAGYALTTLVAIEGLPDAIASKATTAAEQIDRALRRAERAIALPADDVAGKQREADAIDVLLGPVVQAAGELTESAATLPSPALPTTGAGPQDAFVVQVHVDGDVAATTELWVATPPRIYLPYGERR